MPRQSMVTRLVYNHDEAAVQIARFKAVLLPDYRRDVAEERGRHGMRDPA